MASDRLRTSPLDTEHLDEQSLLPERVHELIADGHTVKVVDRHLVVNDKPDDDSSGYIVTEIETAVEPDADAETITLFVCHCSHGHYRVFDWDSVGGPEGAAPSDDKHVARVLRSEKRARDTDDDQKTLLGDGGQSKCVECGGYLPDEIDPETGVYCPRCGTGQLLADGGQVLVDNLTVNDTPLVVWGLDPYAEGDEIHVSALIAVSEHTGHTSLPEVGEVVACETSDGEEFRGEVVSLGLEGQGGLALNVRLIEGAENWEGQL